MPTPPLPLTRRNAGLPGLDTLDHGLLSANWMQRALVAALPLITLASFAGAYGARWYGLLPLIVLAHFVASVGYLHDVAHGSAGIDARRTHWVLFAVSVAMLQSGHAFRYTHLFHHTHCLAHDDMEGAAANMPLPAVLLSGPTYLKRLWCEAMRKSGSRRERHWMVAEAAGALTMAAGALWLTRWSVGPLLYCAFMVVGAWFYPLATAYLPHYKPGAAPLEQARTMRGVIVPVLFMNLTYHLEHHLYPQVPSFNLRRLARRLDPVFAARGLRPTQVY